VSAIAVDTEDLQARVEAALLAHALRPVQPTGVAPLRPRPFVPPDFPSPVVRPSERQAGSSPVDRSLAVANYVRRLWSAWLQTEDERRKRAMPKGSRPASMPAGLDSTEITELPLRFGDCF
jgi:hypothetical protein